MLVADAGNRALRRRAGRRRLFSLRADADERPRFAADDFFAGARPGLGLARVDAQSAHARGHLCAGDAARRRGGRLMQVFLTLFRRELGNYFLSMIGYIIIAAVMFLTGYSFVVLLIKLQQVPTPMPITEMFYVTPFFWMILLLAAPAITM